MGHRAYVDVIENEKTTVFYAHWGANELTVIDRLREAYEIRRERNLKTGLSEIMGCLEYSGYYSEKAAPNKRVFVECDTEEAETSKLSFEDLGDIEMKITLDLDRQTVAYHYASAWYGDDCLSFEISLSDAFKALKVVEVWADKKGIGTFWEIARTFGERLRRRQQFLKKG